MRDLSNMIVLSFLAGCSFDSEDKGHAHAVVELRPEKSASGPVRLHASFPAGIDAENYAVVDSSVHLFVTGALQVNGSAKVYDHEAFPWAPARDNKDFLWTFPDGVALGPQAVEFMAVAEDESGFASADTVRFRDKCPAGSGSYAEYVDPACSP